MSKKIKQKTRKSIVNRFKFTKNGKVLRGRSFTSHLQSKKSGKQKRRLKGMKIVKGSFALRLKKRMGVSTKNK